MEDNRISDVLQASQRQEAEAWDLFERKFDKQFPSPIPPNVRLMAAIGWQFIATSIQAIASVILASLRTAQMFFDAAAGSNPLLQFVEAGAAIFAIELGIVIFSTIKSEMKNSAQRIEDLNRALDVSTKLLNTGIGAGVVVSIIAGLGVSFEGFGLDVWWFEWALAITMALGASIIAWVSGDILGAMLARFSNARLAAHHQYNQDVVARDEMKNQMWERSPERKIAVSQMTELKMILEAQRRDNVPQARRAVPQSDIPKPQRTGNNDVRNQVYAYLDRTYQMESRIAGPSELARVLGVAKGYVGGEKGVIRQWITERNIPTSESAEHAPE